MSGDVALFLDLVSSQHRDKPKFTAVLTALLQPLADNLAVLGSLPAAFDVDYAEGVQLDAVGLWVGRSRLLAEPLDDVYFAWDDADLGWDVGIWKGPFDPSTGIIELPDDAYRILLKGTIATNQWDGTIPGAYANWNSLVGASYDLQITDHNNMTMSITVANPPASTVDQLVLAAGYMGFKPAGVAIV